MFRNRSVQIDHFSMIPRADIPRSQFRMEFTHKTTFNAGYLIPLYVDEVLPGDSFNVNMTMLTRMATPIYPLMDNIYLDTFFFFVPARLLWNNWQRFMGERDPNPDSSIDFIVPTITTPPQGCVVGSLGDYLGLPTVGQINASVNVNALPLRAYNLIWNEWFRDENLQNSVTVPKTDGPDTYGTYALLKRGKRKDYFTASLPWVQKGESVSLPLGVSAPVKTQATPTVTGAQTAMLYKLAASGNNLGVGNYAGATSSGQAAMGTAGMAPGGAAWPTTGLQPVYPSNLYADLTEATASTINQLRQSFQIQKLLERDARGGTRYTELLRSHFGVTSPDARLQRPEYLGGGTSMINIHQVVQQSGTPNDPDTGYTSTPQGHLSAYAQGVGHAGFHQSFTEHGYVLGLVSARADLTYQQGLRKLWSRSTRYDFYWPVFAMLGEQAVLNKEIYVTGTASDNDVFGYQERWAEYRHHPSRISGLFKSTSAGTLDGWHLAQNFSALPTLNATFIEENPPMDRILAAGAAADTSHFILDSLTSIRAARPMPMFSVPGLVDHF